ncbi:MAG: homogentisate 1,2-dioxygenase, partial [Haliea sp.]
MTANTQTSELSYLTGFGNEHETEALAGALPIGRFSPQRVNHGLYAEQFSSTAFTAPRAANRRTWLYRIRPSVVQGDYEPCTSTGQGIHTGPLAGPTPPNMLRWDPLPLPGAGVDLLDGMTTIATCGDALAQTGVGIHLYAASESMEQRYFYSADGEWLFIPQQGEMLLRTECGRQHLQPGDIAVVP